MAACQAASIAISGTRGASSAAAKIYSNNALFGPIPAGFRGVRPLIAENGVLAWRTSPYARHVFGPASILHAVNRPLIREVPMACNTPSHGYPDWAFTDLTAVSIWRTTRCPENSQSRLLPDFGRPRRRGGQAAALGLSSTWYPSALSR